MPVITISRMFGSGGSEVAARVADGLGWTLLDNALVERVAARLGRTPVEVQAIEERVPSLAERFADALALGSPEIVSPSLSGRRRTSPSARMRSMCSATRHVRR